MHFEFCLVFSFSNFHIYGLIVGEMDDNTDYIMLGRVS